MESSDSSSRSKGGSYISDHTPAVTSFHSIRNVPNSAPHLLPYLSSLPPNARILDVGCGPGSMTVDIARRAPQARVLGIDYVGSAFPESADRPGEEPLPSNVRFEVADVLAEAGLPFDEGLFEVVHVHQVLQHVAEPVKALRELRRVVKRSEAGAEGKGGGIVTLRESASMTWYPPLPFLERWQALYRCLAEARGGNPHPGARLHVWCMEAGWKREEIECSTGTWCFSEGGGKEAWSGTMAGRAAAGEFRKGAVEAGLASEDEMDAFAKEWKAWGEREDAWWCVTHGQVVCHS